MSDVKKIAKLSLPDGQEIELPVITDNENEKSIDISNLRKESGYITFDEGFGNTGSCKSAITYIDGDKGILRYRGIPIEQLAEHSDFIETSYLLIYGELPSQNEYHEFKTQLTRHTLLHEDMKSFYGGFPRDAHPMAILASVVAACSTFYQDWQDPRNKARQDQNIIRLLAKLPTMAAYSYKKAIGQPFMYPRNDLSYSANFLHMMFATPAEEYFVEPEVEKALDLLLIIHADHEQNCSTSTVRLAGSSMTNLYAAVSAGISALWGPRHGGANQRVMEMLHSIANEGGNVKEFMDRAKDKQNQTRLMGFGHRVYKNYDPRAKIIKKACDDVLKKLNKQNQLLDIAMGLEEIALKDDYFVERKLYPNVDFYSGIIYSALGIPINGFTAMFALGRLPGWIAQWREMVNDPNDVKIGRPRQVYLGENERNYIPREKRG